MCSVLLDDRQAFRHSSLSLYCGCCYEVLPISNCHRGLWESFQQSHPEKATTVEETGFHSSYRCTSLHTHVFLMKPSAQERSLQKKGCEVRVKTLCHSRTSKQHVTPSFCVWVFAAAPQAAGLHSVFIHTCMFLLVISYLGAWSGNELGWIFLSQTSASVYLNLPLSQNVSLVLQLQR